MICNKCGAKNSDRRTRCFNCGTYFSDPESININASVTDIPEIEIQSLDYDEAQITESDENEFIDEINDIRIEQYPLETSDEIIDIGEESLSEEDDAYPPLMRNTAEDLNPGDQSSDESHYRNAQAKKTQKKKSYAFTTVIWILIIFFIIIAILLGVLIYKYITQEDDIPQAPTVNSVVELNLRQPLVIKGVDSNGREYISATFYGEPGDRIYLECNGQSYTFIEEILELPHLYLEDLFSSEFKFKENETSVNANLNAYLIRNNKRYACNVEPFIMSVPLADLELKSPVISGSDTNKKVFSDSYTIHLWTGTDSKVTLNNTDITSFMDGLGNVKYTVNVPEDSFEIYQLEISQPYHSPIKKLFTISRDKLEMVLTIATSNAFVISEPKITVSGNTDQKAVITSNLPILEQSFNELYNTYNVVLDLSGCDYGQIEAIITATGTSGSVSSLSHTFWYWPDETKVTTSASKFTANTVNNPSKYNGTNFVISLAKQSKKVKRKAV